MSDICIKDGDDWVQSFVNDKLVFESHSFDFRHLEAIAKEACFKFTHEIGNFCFECQKWLPESENVVCEDCGINWGDDV